MDRQLSHLGRMGTWPRRDWRFLFQADTQLPAMHDVFFSTQVHEYFREMMKHSVVGDVDSPPLLDLGGQTSDQLNSRKLRITGMKNRFGRTYDAELSEGYRDLSLNVEVCWVRHANGITFLPVSDWGTQINEHRHICEVQIHLKAMIEVIFRPPPCQDTAMLAFCAKGSNERSRPIQHNYPPHSSLLPTCVTGDKPASTLVSVKFCRVMHIYVVQR